MDNKLLDSKDFIKKRIDVTLTDKEMDFIKMLSDRDGKTIQDTLKDLFYLQLREEIEYYEESGL